MAVITGHNDLNYHRHLRIPAQQPECRLCKEERETSFHLFAQCPRLLQSRALSTGAHYIDNHSEQWDVHHIVQFVRLPYIQDALRGHLHGYLLLPPSDWSDLSPDSTDSSLSLASHLAFTTSLSQLTHQTHNSIYLRTRWGE